MRTGAFSRNSRACGTTAAAGVLPDGRRPRAWRRGAVARLLLAAHGIRVDAAAVELGGIAVPPEERELSEAFSRPYYAASAAVTAAWDARVAEAPQGRGHAGRHRGDTRP